MVEPPFEPQPAITISATAEQRMLEAPVWVLILLVAAWDTRLSIRGLLIVPVLANMQVSADLHIADTGGAHDQAQHQGGILG